MSTGATVTAVIPIMGHPVLVDDALASAAELLDQGTLSRIIAVDDGCPHDETRAALAAWRANLGAPHMTVIRQPNRGLSAARNAGIAAALAGPVVPDAIFLLDADNRLARGAGDAFAALLGQWPDTDWFYPSFDFFGEDGHFATELAPSPLLHMLANHSEAGSLIRHRVFASGLRFDETMREGYEDWDFFLAAQERGFSGRPAGRPMLEYRKRPSSMLSGSHGLDAQLRRQIARRHRWLFSAHVALAREQADFPRFAFVEPETVFVGTDPTRLSALAPDAFEATIMRHFGAPLRHHTPAITILADAGFRDSLLDSGLLRGLLWAIERRFMRAPGCHAIAVTTEASGDLARIGAPQPWAPADRVQMVALRLSALGAAARGEVPLDDAADVDAAARHFNAEMLPVELPDGAPRAGDARKLARRFLSRLAHSRYRPSLSTRWEWRDTGGAQSRAMANEAPRLTASGGPLLPLVPEARARREGLDIGFTLPIFDQGGVERVAHSIARALAAEGHRCHLFVIGGRPARFENGLRPDTFATISFFPDPSAADWHGAEYLGTAGTSWGNPEECADLEGLLRPMDVVINAHSAAVHRVADALRRGGTMMIDHEHVLEVSRYGRSYGPPVLALAHEHAYDAILTCSTTMADWLSAHGVPADKLIPVVNAPGYPMDADAVTDALAQRRRNPLDGAPLSILYLGRLDEQKGIDRVASIFSALSRARRGMRLTVAGRSIVGAAATLSGLPPETRLPGPLEGVEALTASLLDADILLLPSRYEGLPLVILEAQRLGCVPVATAVGAIGEVITSGENGILIDEADAVAQGTAAIIALDSDRKALTRMLQFASANTRNWNEATTGLRQRIALHVNGYTPSRITGNP